MGRGLVAAAVVGAVLVTAGSARAQTSGDSPPEAPVEQESTFADATGLTWGVVSFESWLLVQGLALALSDGCGDSDDELTCALLVAASSLTAGIAAGLVAGDRDAPADAPFVLHHGLWGGFAGMALGAGLAGDDDEDRAIFATAGLALGTTILAGYTWKQRDRLLHDPDAALGAHLMTWGVPLAALVGGIVGALIDDDGPVVALAMGLATAFTYGIAIAAAES